VLFNSYIFLLVFLPIVVAGFYVLGARLGQRSAVAWLLGASLLFYGYWHPPYLILLVLSILANHTWAGVIDRARGRSRKVVATVGIAANLMVLGYYKYALFLLGIFAPVAGHPGFLRAEIVLPIGISFYTFQQIAYLCDVRDRVGRRRPLAEYAFFVSFFPQLIAGPIVHHHELLPQLRNRLARLRLRQVAPGVALFLMGLCKKSVFADRMAPLANSLFDASSSSPGFADAWLGTSAYTLQLYFDFSGYSDMACGLALMFNLRLPANFASPYKAVNIIDFWRRWHITLSHFLRDYLYIPLGGSRGSAARRTATLMVTMLLGGLWHGAGWTFVAWGGLHGAALAANHMWRDAARRRGRKPMHGSISRPLTLLWVAMAWVFFRSSDFGTAIPILKGMAGIHGFGDMEFLDAKDNQYVLMAILWLIVLLAPSSLSILRHYRPCSGRLPFPSTSRLRVKGGLLESPAGALTLAAFLLIVLLNMPRVSEFIYFQF
jgi:alginate O-acetyltransferase complex protein AlgI